MSTIYESDKYNDSLTSSIECINLSLKHIQEAINHSKPKQSLVLKPLIKILNQVSADITSQKG